MFSDTVPVVRWEYVTVSVTLDQFATLEAQLNDLGQTGWEMVGFARSDRLMGEPAAFRAVLKRELD